MPTYQYKAITSNGQIVKNTVAGLTKKELADKLKRNGLSPLEINQVSASASKYAPRNKKQNTGSKGNKDKSFLEKLKSNLNIKTRITKRDIMVFTQSFLVLKRADFNNIHALSTVIESTENPTLKTILEDVLAGVEEGKYMYTTMEYYETIFPAIYTNMIKVGELSGTLVKSLEQAINYLESSDALTKKVRKIVLPNLLQFVGMLLLLIIGTLYAIPAIQDVFEEVGSQEQLPAVTLWFSNFLNSFMIWWYIPAIIIASIIILIIVYVHTPTGKFRYHKFKYKMPIFGSLIYALDFSRLMKAVSLNIKNGMRIQQALEVSKNVVKNKVMLAIVDEAINNSMVGKSWVTPFEQAGLGNRMTTEMLKVGMQTDLGVMLDKLLEYTEMDIDNILQRIMKILPEVSYAIVGIVLIFFVIVVLVPCVQVYMGSFLFSAYL